MNIYLYHRPLTDLLGKSVGRLGRDDRLILAHHRDALLGAFCHQHALPPLVINTHTHGKPYCVDSPLHFNQSHGHRDYVLAFSHKIHDIGVDIEHIERNVRHQDLAKAYFSDDEQAFWQADDYSRESFFAIWTAKEALLKAHGLGIRLALNTLNTKPNQGWSYPQHIYHDKLGAFSYQSFLLDKVMISVAWRTTDSVPNFAFI